MGETRARIARTDPVVSLAVALAALPIVVAGVRAIARGWIPIGDDALFEMRARDVLTSHHPWLGTWSSASLQLGVDVNHPGPLVFDVLALPVKLFGGGAGVIVGVVVINVAAIVTVAALGHHNAGRVGGVVVMLPTAFLGWIMGSELLFDPWNPHVAMFPFLATLAGAWSIAHRHWRGLLAYAAFGSLCLQAHLGYAYLVPSVGLGALAAAWFVGPGDRRPLPSRRAIFWSVGLLVVLWSQPLGEQFFGPGQGNIARLVSNVGGGDTTAVGPRLALRLAAAVLTSPPWSARDGFMTAIPITTFDERHSLLPVHTVAGAPATVRLLALVVALGVAVVIARRRRDDAATAALATSGIALIAIAIALTLMPLSTFGLSPHQARWLWPTAAWIWCSLLLAVVPAIRDRWSGRDERIACTPVLAAIALVAVATVPTHVQPSGPAADAGRIPLIRELTDRLHDVDLRDRSPLLVDHSNVPFGDAYSAAVFAELDADGVELRFVEEGLVRQFGESRRADGSERFMLRLVYGAEALPDNEDRVALVSGVDPDADRVAVYVVPLD